MATETIVAGKSVPATLERAMAVALITFLTALQKSIADNTFVKLRLGDYRGPDDSLRKITVKPIRLARGEHLCFVYRHKRKDVTKNMPPDQGSTLIAKLVETDFRHASLLTTTDDFELTHDKQGKPRLHTSRATHQNPATKEHNRAKKRLIDPLAPYLALLGVTSQHGKKKNLLRFGSKFRLLSKPMEMNFAQDFRPLSPFSKFCRTIANVNELVYLDRL